MKRNRLFLLFGITILVIFCGFALFPEMAAPYGLKEMDQAWLPCTGDHWLGTNDMGYDIFTELVYASRSSMLIGLASAFVSLVIGSFLGILAGYLPGWKGELAGAVIQMFLLIPMLPMAIVIGAFLGNGTGTVVAVIATLGWCATARTVRTRTMQLKQMPFVEALMILDIPRSRIMFCHILPNLREVVLSRYIMSVARCMMMEATLSFLGMGNPAEVTWGRMMNLAYKRGGFTKGAYNYLAAPGICIAFVVIAFTCINQYIEVKNREVSGAQSFLD